MDILGVDIGGVIIKQIDRKKSSSTSFMRGDFLKTPPVEDVFEYLALLVREKFGDNVDVVSKCGSATEALSREWLKQHNFYERTGINPARVFFRPDLPSKAECVAERKHTHFIDNHPGGLGLMNSVRCRVLQGASNADKDKFADQLPKFTFITPGWAETTSKLLKG